jgi:hypothetical protein
MTEQEQIEKWREEFCEFMKKDKPLLPLGMLKDLSAFADRDVWYLFEGFLMAKRNMPVIELPKGHIMDDPDGMGRGRYLMIETVERALNRAGAQYTIKGE